MILAQDHVQWLAVVVAVVLYPQVVLPEIWISYRMLANLTVGSCLVRIYHTFEVLGNRVTLTVSLIQTASNSAWPYFDIRKVSFTGGYLSYLTLKHQ